LSLGFRHIKRLIQKAETNQLPRNYWSITKQRFLQNRSARWSWRILLVLIVLALSADFIANEKPLYCQYKGESYFPVFRSYGVDLGLLERKGEFFTMDWLEEPFESAVRPLVPYSPHTKDRNNARFKSPFDEQNVRSLRYRHWLGTDKFGRDTLAGLVHGTRTALLVGLIAMGLAALIGIVLGAFAGYFGDDGWRLSRSRLIMNVLALIVSLYLILVAKASALRIALGEERGLVEMAKVFGLVVLVFVVFNVIGKALEKVKSLAKPVAVPSDLIIMRLIEIFNSVPGLLLLLAIVGILRKPSLVAILTIIGLISWTGIARFVRAEMLRIRELEYIQATKVMGFSNFRTIFRHALPNALTPVLITISFGVAGAILLEATLSFLNISNADSITWGTMLNEARSRVSAWWLAIFPGLTIFVTVTIFNLMGEGLGED